jgi:hypothetical protein
VFRSLLVMDFRLIVMSNRPVKNQILRSKSGLGNASSAQAKHSSDGLEECPSGQGTVGLQYDWGREDGKCGEGLLLGWNLV